VAKTYGDGSIFPRGPRGILYVSVYDPRSRKTIIRSTKSTKPGVASAKRRQMLAAIASGTNPLPARRKKLRFEDLEALVYREQELTCDKSPESVRSGFNQLGRSFAGCTYDEITDERIEQHVMARRKDFRRRRDGSGALVLDATGTPIPPAPATLRTEIGYLQRAFAIAIHQKKIPPSAMPNFTQLKRRLFGRIQNARKVFIPAEATAGILGALPRWLRPLVEFISLVGWRRGEPERLTWMRNVDFINEEIRIEGDQTKGEDERVIPFGKMPRLRAVLVEQRRYVERRERKLGCAIAWVFPRPNGKAIRDFRKLWKKACAAAGYVGGREGFTVHDFRRTVARKMEIELRIPRPIAKAIIGHKTDAMYYRYAIGSRADIAAAGALLDAAHRKILATAGRKVTHAPRVVSETPGELPKRSPSTKRRSGPRDAGQTAAPAFQENQELSGQLGSGGYSLLDRHHAPSSTLGLGCRHTSDMAKGPAGVVASTEYRNQSD
jgi:integrase